MFTKAAISRFPSSKRVAITDSGYPLRFEFFNLI
jgi:hypothetical protein